MCADDNNVVSTNDVKDKDKIKEIIDKVKETVDKNKKIVKEIKDKEKGTVTGKIVCCYFPAFLTSSTVRLS